MKDSDGTEQIVDTLHNLDENSAASFDGEWERLNKTPSRLLESPYRPSLQAIEEGENPTTSKSSKETSGGKSGTMKASSRH